MQVSFTPSNFNRYSNQQLANGTKPLNFKGYNPKVIQDMFEKLPQEIAKDNANVIEKIKTSIRDYCFTQNLL